MPRTGCCGGPIAGGSIWKRCATALLVAAGRLDETMGGPSVSAHRRRRSPRAARVYGFIERQNLPAFFRTFDFANPNTHTPERPQTDVAAAGAVPHEQPVRDGAGDAAGRAQRSCGSSRAGPATAAPMPNESAASIACIRFALGREPTVDELADALEFVDRGEPADAADDRASARLAVRLGHVSTMRRAAVQFQPLPHFTGDAWQGGDELPDPTLGWAMLNASGGHPGDAAHLAIRRWIAPAAGTLHIEGVLSPCRRAGRRRPRPHRRPAAAASSASGT